jgi:tRNA (guanine-N7-)-methyltransferase
VRKAFSVTRPARHSLDALQPYLLDVPHPKHLPPDAIPKSVEPLDWTALFGRAAPLEIEIGFGKGLFLCDAARAFPHVNFFGIEIERKYVISTAARLAKLALPHVKVTCTEARWFMAMYVPAETVDAVHVYFPDPWWKKKHKKRKLFTPDFARETFRVLKADGVFHFATDVQAYFDESLALIRTMGQFVEHPWPADHIPDLMTNFERKYRAEGRPIYRTRFAKS